jgi:predicted GNAT family acetyltransferase
VTVPSDAADALALTVRHQPEQRRFIGVLDGEIVTVADYRDRDGVMVMHHTHTVPAHGGNGYAKQVVTAALDEFRAQGKQVAPQCWFVAQVIDEEPQYADLVAS